MKRRIFCLLLLLSLLCGSVYAAGSAKSPSAIKVNRALNTVTVYGLDENGNHTIPVKAMICSTARKGYYTPLGTFTLIGYRSEWRPMLDGTYGQYATSFNGHYLFHSICYEKPSKDAMLREEYNDLGGPASMGCVRLQTVDAKWIYDNCPAGTKVTVYEDPDVPGPLGKPEKLVSHITEQMYAKYNGWDPTDPAAGNPWTFTEAESLAFVQPELPVTAGIKQQLRVEVTPAEAAECGMSWKSSDPSVVRIDADGAIVGLSAGTAQITATSWNGVSATCTVTVTGQLLPFDDLTPGAWYYGELRSALQQGLLHGLGNSKFGPEQAMTRAMVVQMLYNLEHSPKTQTEAVFTDVAEDAWFRDAVLWAYGKGIVTGASETEFEPERAMSRQELAAVLWRYAGAKEAEGDLSVYDDWEQAADYAQMPLRWMTASLIPRWRGVALPAAF